MDNDLERSIRLLEGSLSTSSKGIFREEKFRRPEYSFMITPNEIDVLQTSSPSAYNDTMALLADTDATIRGSIIQSGSPWTTTTNNLYQEFAEILQTNSDGSDVLEVAENLARCCSDALTVVQKLKSKITLIDSEEDIWLENERNNWRLLYILYQDRIQTQNNSDDDFMDYIGTSEKKCVEKLYKSTNLLREAQLIIDWLERNALEKDDPIMAQSDWTYGWEHTLHQLTSPDSIAIGSNVNVITSIYPDAPHVQNLSLHHLDHVNEKQLCRRIFTEIRCGNLDAAQKLCYSCGHPSRSAMLEGWRLFHNPNEKNDSEEMDVDGMETSPALLVDDLGNSYSDLEGNANRDLWKVMAIQYSKAVKLDIYEKAAVAALCGYLEAMLPVSNSWEDHLWACMKTMVDIYVESEIRDRIPKNYMPLPEEYWDQRMSLQDVFNYLEASKNPTVRSESLDKDHIVQKHIILGEIPQLIRLVEEWCEEPKASIQSIRFYAHLVLFLSQVENTDWKSCEKIIETYVTRLGQLNESHLVAYYVSKLGKEKQIVCYSAYLEKITDNESRKDALAFAEEFGLDVFAITSRVVETIRNLPTEVEAFGNLHPKLSLEDEVKISALDWLTFYEMQRLEALEQTSALIFKFLTLGKLEAAQLAMNKIPSDAIEKITNQGELNEEIDRIMKEHLSYKAYLEAQEGFNAWFTQYKNKPMPPADLQESAQFTEKVAHQHRVSQYNAETERWKLLTSHSAKAAKTLLYNVLLFPKGWLLGSQDAEYLRSVCLPEVVLLLYSVLSESGLHEEAVQLADLLASERHRLYLVYSKEKLAEILEKICESSVALLNAKKDPWGNTKSA